MSYPQNPETIVIQNSYYPKGLREIDVWNYYQKNKSDLLKQVRNRNVVLGIMTDVNKPIIRRKLKGEDTIRLTNDNYDTIITGRTVTVYSEMDMYERFGIIDIDVDPNYDGFKWARKVALDVYDYAVDKMPFLATASIRFTGKTSFHIICDFGKKVKIDVIRFLLGRELRNSPLSKVYTVEGKRSPGIPNLDLSPNKFRGVYITPYSLSIIGLQCQEVPYSEVRNFNISKAIIREV